ncbi:bifunctional 23S rRNA (guanine(2069)-N(7))-methyltransferase RlmK/23S rRNA (guanine(2445)-N(2))-methyltransferase RlmL [Agaribacterium sp. ZY112]|uniref:bifunctional 23S rRNA (guanine(2069)-N(7))-methyltransferase RlmK/23S rRNA (guanine(2445)-N(2))-methyltransferase RlmL n=1 Tax=Agaribacterium sp. ZY112 TaxID=3233574 RepID=UPI003524C31F
MNNDTAYKLFITCPAGVEALLESELKGLGISELKQTVSGVFVQASIEQIYQINLWSRLANRVLLLLNEAPSGDRDALYDAVAAVDWFEHMEEGARLRVDFAGSNDHLRHTQFSARVVKDAIVDQFVQRAVERPDVDLQHPTHRINVRLGKRTCYVALDLSGDSLHKRGYRQAGGMAPLKENLAAAILVRSGWPARLEAFNKQTEQSQLGFIDPMCGSGTLLIEAAMMAFDQAPGLLRKTWGFSKWRQHQQELWQDQHQQAIARNNASIAKQRDCNLLAIKGFEIEASISEQAHTNIKRAGLAGLLDIQNTNFLEQDLGQGACTQGLLVCNPPYGMRLGEAEKLSFDYRELAAHAKTSLTGWRMALFSSNTDLLGETRLRYERKYKFMNGAIACELRLYQLDEESSLSREEREPRKKPLSEGAAMVANRLRKNLSRLKSWRTQHSINAFRAYDADLPEYSAAIDVYADQVHIQEYQAPAKIDPRKTEKRFKAILEACADVFSLKEDELYVKTRQRNRGANQYQRQSAPQESDFFSVQEGQVQLAVNLKSYLDTGLFLDHRPLRLKIANEIKGKSFLNLFCYTASATMHAIKGGACDSISVDMSKTYLSWAERNLELNNFKKDKHQLVRADVRQWLKECRQGFDVIMLDPPSFSNSKRMDDSFDVQRDHTALVERCMELLKPGGVLYFSNNLRSFKIDTSLQERFNVEDITTQSIDKDYERNKKIHCCFKLVNK